MQDFSIGLNVFIYMRLDILNNNERVLHGGVSNASHGCQLFIIKKFELFIKFIFSLKTCQIVFK